METIARIAGTLPAWAAAAAAIAAALAATLLALGARELMVRAGLSRVIRDAARGILPKSPPRQSILKRRVDWLERRASRAGVRIFEILDVSDAFLADFRRKRSAPSMRRLLAAYPDAGALECFHAALAKAGLRDDFMRLYSGDDAFFRLTSLALANGGGRFDGKAALSLFKERTSQLRELSGNPEWTVRYFAATILVEDEDPASERILWEFLDDSSSSVRKLALSRMRTAEAGRLQPRLRELFLLDANRGVREAAKERLRREFPKGLRIDIASLGKIESIHALELLEPGSAEDENAALAALEGEDLELRLQAARFLQRTGVLERALRDADFGDRELLGRSLARLEHAAEVGVSAFLSKAGHDASPASVFLALRVLARSGDRSLIAALVRRAFSLAGAVPASPELADLYAAALKCARARGTREAAEAVAAEIEAARLDPRRLGTALGELPAGHDDALAPTLLGLIEDLAVEPEDALRDALASLDKALVLPRVLDIVKSGRGEYADAVRARSLRLLCALKVPYAIQTILEALPDLPEGDIPVFARSARDADEAAWDERAAYALASSDARLRTAVIRALPKAGWESFKKEIREALTDADPDVRLAAVSALSESDDSKTLNAGAVELLRDPVERVRTGAARALGKAGGEAVVEALAKVALDPNETESVIEAAFEGLGSSPLPASVDALAGLAERGMDMPFAGACAGALAGKIQRKPLERLLERFKDAGTSARAVFASAFPLMGEEGEKALMDLLAEEILALKPYICEALEATGFIDARIARLAHRNPVERRSAARDLSLIASPKAYKGIVLAARDPDPEIRVLVAKALDFLNSPAGEPILEVLKTDPDRRVRRYMAWAIERCKARAAT